MLSVNLLYIEKYTNLKYRNIIALMEAIYGILKTY